MIIINKVANVKSKLSVDVMPQLLGVMVHEIPPEPELRWDIYPFPFCVQDSGGGIRKLSDLNLIQLLIINCNLPDNKLIYPTL